MSDCNNSDSFDEFAIDVTANRQAKKWTKKELAGRFFWEMLGGPLFRCTPRPFWACRRCWLRLFGAKIGQNVHVHPTVHIAVPWNLSIADDASVGDGAILYTLGKIHIGRAATISQYAHLCAGTHDHKSRKFALVKAPITIGSGAWICAEAFVGPGVTVGALAIVGARSVLVRDAPSNTVLGGNPARVLKKRPPFEG